MRRVLSAAAAVILLPISILFADDAGDRWVSVPRAAVTIVVGKDVGHVVGPDWERTFDPARTVLDFEIEPGRRMIVRRVGDRWVGEYTHPRVRPGDHEFETHLMAFDRDSQAAH